MEPIIHDTTPKGSALLAYGEDRRPSFRLIILAVSIVAVLSGVIFLVSQLIFAKTIPLPKDTSLLLFTRGNPTLPPGSPSLWKEVRHKYGSLPMLMGLAKTPEGQFAYALTPAVGAWQLIASRSLPTEQVSLASLGDFRQLKAKMWLRIWPNESDSSFGGPVLNNRWQSDLAVAPDGLQDLPVLSPNFIYVKAFPKLWSQIEDLFREHGVDLRLSSPPAYVYWTLESDSQLSIQMGFDGDLITTSTKIELLGGAGLSDRKSYALPDGTVINELKLPQETLESSATSSWELENNRQITFQNGKVILGNSAAFKALINRPDSCQGQLIAAFSQETIENVYKKLGFSDYPQLDGLFLTLDKGKVTFCW